MKVNAGPGARCALMVLIACLQQACASHGVRCEGPLQPINTAVQNPAVARTEPGDGP